MNGEDRLTARKVADELLPEVKRIQVVIADNLKTLQYLWGTVEGHNTKQCLYKSYALVRAQEYLADAEDMLCRLP